MSITGAVGQSLVVEVVLADRATGKFPQARFFDDTKAQVGSPVDLGSLPARPYAYQGPWTPPGAGHFSVVVDVYDDAAHTILSIHEPGIEHVRIGEELAASDSFLDAALNVHDGSGTVGLAAMLTHFGGAVHIDTGAGSPGTDYPIGTEEQPVDNLADAITIANAFGIRRFHIRGNLTLTSALPDWVFIGDGEEAEIAINGQDVADSEFESLVLSGTIGTGPISVRACVLDGLDSFSGTATECAVTANGVSLGGSARFVRCSSAVAGTGTPFVDLDGTGRTLELRDWIGGVELRGLADAGDNVSIDSPAGQVVLAASCTAGTVAIRGIGNLTENQDPAVVVERKAYLSLPVIADAVWDEAVQQHLTVGTAGEAIASIFAHSGGHVRDDALTYDANNRPLTLRRRVFPDAATAAASTPGGTGEGEIMTFSIDATHIDAARWQSLLRRRTS